MDAADARSGAIPDFLPAGAVLATFAVSWLVRDGRDGWAFAMTAFAIAATVATFFIDLYPTRDGVQHEGRQQPHDPERLVLGVLPG